MAVGSEGGHLSKSYWYIYRRRLWTGEDLGALSDMLREADVGKRVLIFFNLLFLKVPDYLILINIDKVR